MTAVHKLERIAHFIPCHRKKERCLHIKGKQIPLCSRCMFISIGILFTPMLFLLPTTNVLLMLITGVLLNILMVMDGWTQKKRWRMSNNWLRSITGLGSGVGLGLILISTIRLLSDWLLSF